MHQCTLGIANLPEGMPKWIATIDKFTNGGALGLSALLAGVNPKNLALTLAAALTIVQANLSGAHLWIALAVFVLLASLTVTVPVWYDLLAGQAAERMLNSWKSWLVSHNATVMFRLLLV
jgi:hypothetical protein